MEEGHIVSYGVYLVPTTYSHTCPCTNGMTYGIHIGIVANWMCAERMCSVREEEGDKRRKYWREHST